MTGSSFTALLFVCALPVFSAMPVWAQMPNAGDTGPNSSLSTAAPPSTSAPDTPPSPTLPASSVPHHAQLDIRFRTLAGPLNHPAYEAVQVTYGGELTLSADQADADQTARQYTLTGNVRAHETDTTLRASEITFNGQSQDAVATDALLTRSFYSIRAPRLVGTPDLITAYNGSFTTVPDGGPADYYLRAQTITLDSLSHRGALRNATLYLFGTRLVTIKRLSFGFDKSGGTTQHRVIIPTVGYSGRYGAYLAFGNNSKIMHLPVQYRLLLPTRQSVQALVTSQQTLYAPSVHAPSAASSPAGPVTLLERIRTAATVPPGPLPEGDPLRFQDILPDPNPIQLFNDPSHGGLYLGENLSVHIAASGRRRDDLYVSRLPELSLSGDIPLSPVPHAPTPGDPQSFRNALRHIVLYAQAQETVGDYREQLSIAPYSIRERRTRSQFGFITRPLLIAPNTVLLPSVSISSSSYSGSKSAYRYDQINIAVNHYFSDSTAVGVQFLAGSTGGDSPFNFDVLDTDRELDLRLQTGNAHLVAASRIRYDLAKGGVIDYQVALGPALRGFTPILSYSFRTRSIGLGIEIKGLTF